MRNSPSRALKRNPFWSAFLFLWAGYGIGADMPRLTPRPVAVSGVRAPLLDLGGTWQFHPQPPESLWRDRRPSDLTWSEIQVPGEWAMQGFSVEKEKAAAYHRTIAVPADWRGRRIKLRCDAVYSWARIWVNGRWAGEHMGGFTPFELDVTALAETGRENDILLSVQNESPADVLASGTQYAVHPLGGITRKIQLLAVPEVNIVSWHTETEWAKEKGDAILRIIFEVGNESRLPASGLKTRFRLTAPDGTAAIEPAEFALADLPAGAEGRQVLEIPVKQPKPWDSECPFLYELTGELGREGAPLQTVRKKIGFRQIEIRENRLFVNGRPVKLRGINRHEVHPLRGRSLEADWWRRDAELFKSMNCNYIRTSHYPPAEEFVEACDEIGLFIEEEAPFCWVGHEANATWKSSDPSDPRNLNLIVSQTLEMIQRDRSHPSVLIWSLANESEWNANFAESLDRADRADPTRPKSFHDQSWGEYNNKGSRTQIANYHYPDLSGPDRAAQAVRPLLFGEYCHLNAYNRRELVTDPGLRNDAWGRNVRDMWEKMYAAPGILGGAIWSGIDDTFFLPGGPTVGYGTWGPIDGWRRPKPEYWQLKKIYAPIRLGTEQLPAESGKETVDIEVENRHDFTNLKELTILCGPVGGPKSVVSADIAPRQKGLIRLPLFPETPDSELALEFFSPQGRLIDSYLLRTPEAARTTPPTSVGEGPLSCREADGLITISGPGFSYLLDKATGRLRGGSLSDREMNLGGPDLMLLPLNSEGDTQMTKGDPSLPFTDTCGDWKAEAVTVRSASPERVEVEVRGAYREARGSFSYLWAADGTLAVTYDFAVSVEKLNPRQIGLVWDLPSSLTRLSWERRGLWSVYPSDHIGRNQGTAQAEGNPVSPVGPAIPPTWAWKDDARETGSNDFRSTKENINWVRLLDRSGRGIIVTVTGMQAARAWRESERIRLLIADYVNPGSERFFRAHAALEDRPLKKGDRITGTVRLRMILAPETAGSEF